MIILKCEEGESMLKVNFEFRKGVLFVRLRGNLDKDNYKVSELNNLIENIGLKYVVINLNDITSIDTYCIDCLINFSNKLSSDNGKILICEKDCLIGKRLLKNRIPLINSELEAFNLI